jgi:hypothetical protein
MVRGQGGFVERIDGGPQGRVVLSGADYAPNGQPAVLRFGNGAETTYVYDESQRLGALRVKDGAGNTLLDETIDYDLVANVTAIVDQRPLADVPASSARRRTAAVHVRQPESPDARGLRPGEQFRGALITSYDPLGNLLRQTTPAAGSPGHISDASVELGDLGYAGGRSGRDGRGALDPPGPHAVTSTASGQQLTYDPSGNVTALGSAALSWDFEDRLVRFQRSGVDAVYVRDLPTAVC